MTLIIIIDEVLVTNNSDTEGIVDIKKQ